jgi:putative nucleotidyltransferase with HDIG domain
MMLSQPPLTASSPADVAERRPVILAVDDELGMLALMRECLRDLGAEMLTVGRGEDALAVLRETAVDLILIDICLPGLSGLDLLEQARSLDPSLTVIMVTGSCDFEVAVRALRQGADDYIRKPFDLDEFRACVAYGLQKRKFLLHGKAYHAYLASQVQQQASDLQAIIRRLEDTYRETLRALGAALDTRDVETHAHSERVAQYALTVGRLFKMNETDLTTLERGVYLHDIGKIGIPDRVLLKQGSLNGEEWAIMRQHALLGYRLASRIDFLKESSQIILNHHERYDGSGYPNGLRGDAIPMGARIFSVVDALDAITSDRPYRKARSFSVARDEINRSRGKQFDPLVVDVFLSVPESTWSEIRESVNQHAQESLKLRT